MSRVTKSTPKGTRVIVEADTASYSPVPAGLTGRIVRVDPVSHATMNGGGWDADVILDADPDAATREQRRANALRSLGIGEDYIARTRNQVRIRSTYLRAI